MEIVIEAYKQTLCQTDVFYVDTAHFHTGIEEEDTGSKHHVVEVRQVGEEAAVEVQVGVSAGGKVDDTQDNQQCGRNNGPDQAADLCHFTYPAHPLHGDECG